MTESGTVRMNISIPRDLKQRMDTVADRANWSAVAAEAFSRKLLDLASTQETKTMQDVIKRMAAADEADANEMTRRGRAAGEEWVRRHARPRQLRTLAAAWDAYQPHGALHVYTNGMNRGIGWGAYADMLGPSDHAPGTRDAEAFWVQALGDEAALIEDWDFATGFFDAALELWATIEKNLGK